MKRLYITTYGRGPQHQRTWANLPPAVRAYTVLVVAKEEARAFAGFPLLICPLQGHSNLGAVRQWCMEVARRAAVVKVALFDDDLAGWSRRGMTTTGDTYARTTPVEVGRAIARMWKHLDRYAHGGIPISLYALGHKEIEYNARALDALFYRADVLARERACFDMPLMSDFDMTLKLISLGYPNVIDYYCYQKQVGSNLPGGCSTYRTPEGMDDAARELARRYAPFVTLTKRPSKHWGFERERTDVRVAWRKLAEASGADPRSPRSLLP